MRPTSLVAVLALSLPSLACRSASGPVPLDVAGPLTEHWSIGHWSGHRTAADDGQSEPITIVVEPVLGGQGRLRRLGVPSRDYYGLSVDARVASTGTWGRKYVNGTRGTFANLVADGDLDQDVVTWRSESLVEGTGERGSRIRSERLGTDRWRIEVSRTVDGGRTWSPIFVDDLVRRR